MVWNINGNLALKIREHDFIRFISEGDVVLLLETWLLPGQENTLSLPIGFLLVASSRPVVNQLARQWGGVAVLYRDDIPLTVVQGVSAPDLLVLDLGYCFVVGSYLPPKGSNWHTWTDTDPEQRVQEALAYCAVSRTKLVLLMGDFNARTASNSSLPTACLLIAGLIPEVNAYWNGAQCTGYPY
jgi:exonuclease III